ncbi:MAG: VWA domain-containing protein [Acidobacteria bacterium]|nr:VWA domain-containing protein [Acidobacteriota bacterium]
MFRLASPWFLALSVLPVLLWFLHWWSQKRGRASVLFSGGHLLAGLPQTWRSRLTPYLHWMRYPGLLLLVLALSRPQSGEAVQEISTYGVDIALILDVSGTMEKKDMVYRDRYISRLDAAKQVIAGFIGGRSSDRISLIAFGSNSLTRCPLTTDYDLVAQSLSEIDINLFPEDQRRTAIGNALATGVSRLHKSDAKSKVIILLTDGQNTAGNITPLTAADLAASEGVRVHTIGFGSPGETDVDEAVLQQISERTRGQFFRSTSLEDLQHVYDLLDSLEKSEVVVNNYQVWSEWFPMFLWPGVLLIFLEILLTQLICRSIP